MNCASRACGRSYLWFFFRISTANFFTLHTFSLHSKRTDVEDSELNLEAERNTENQINYYFLLFFFVSLISPQYSKQIKYVKRGMVEAAMMPFTKCRNGAGASGKSWSKMHKLEEKNRVFFVKSYVMTMNASIFHRINVDFYIQSSFYSNGKRQS